ncbi:alpha/beta hydrolase [Ideonella sp.]|uniref:alpha/beta fold hydrolase n=1 Tax=Ideonella sp. TaxID=1929293 RepID=UPI002B461A09|nr:alpha/beta hydrolase [Ideonella sp.]HJV71131.1 alpha/beta hydrolase [Ideonella sp.]
MQVSANGIALEVEDVGPPGGQPLLLIMGLGMQLTSWPDELVQLLVARGFRVIRFDNRDSGLSQGFDHLGVPHLGIATLQHMLHWPVKAPYRLIDMARDAIGVLDALGVRSAHVLGASLGGMVAQHLAAEFPERVRSLNLMMTTSGARRLPQATLAARRVLLQRPRRHDIAALLEHYEQLFRVIGSPAYPPEPQAFRARMLRDVQRAWRPAGTLRQLIAVAADGDRTPLLARIVTPTHVIHGEADPLIPVENGRDLARRIHGATSDFIAGMGHDLPLALLPRYAEGLERNAARAAR